MEALAHNLRSAWNTVLRSRSAAGLTGDRRESAYLQDAVCALEELQEFTGRTTREKDSRSTRLEQFYVIHRLIIFGEAMARLAPI